MEKKQKTKLDPMTMLFLMMFVSLLTAGVWCKIMNLNGALELMVFASLLLGLSALQLSKNNLDKLNESQ